MDTAQEGFEEQLNLSKSIIAASLYEGGNIIEQSNEIGSGEVEYERIIDAHGATLLQLHALLKAIDPYFGGLVRVMNKRQEFMWVHEKFISEY